MHCNRCPALAIFFIVIGHVFTANASEGAAPIFDGKSLKGWTVHFGDDPKDRDPTGVFAVVNGVLHVSGERFGYISTTQSYSDYTLSLEFRWREAKWPPRLDQPRDSGIIYHANGPDIVWCRGLEFQIQENDVGDLWLIPGVMTNPLVVIDGKNIGGTKTFLRAQKKILAENPHGKWNRIQLVVVGDRFEHWVNGKLVMQGRSPQLQHGKIQLQSEGAAIEYRHVQLQPISAKK